MKTTEYLIGWEGSDGSIKFYSDWPYFHSQDYAKTFKSVEAARRFLVKNLSPLWKVYVRTETSIKKVEI